MPQEGGAKALQDLLAREKEEALPEFRRARPKYYYYYNWMRERVLEHCGQLPAPVLEKLIRVDATELDMLLTYPTGVKRQVHSLSYPDADTHKSSLSPFGGSLHRQNNNAKGRLIQVLYSDKPSSNLG